MMDLPSHLSSVGYVPAGQWHEVEPRSEIKLAGQAACGMRDIMSQLVMCVPTNTKSSFLIFIKPTIAYARKQILRRDLDGRALGRTCHALTHVASSAEGSNRTLCTFYMIPVISRKTRFVGDNENGDEEGKHPTHDGSRSVKGRRRQIVKFRRDKKV